MQIRSATHADLPALLEIYNWAVLNTTASAAYEPESLETRTAWFDTHARDGYPVFVAEDDVGRVVGWSSLSKYKERIGYRFTAEDSIYLAPEAQGHGIGKLLLAPLIEAARELKLHAIVGGLSADNVASLKLHAHFGFVEVARFREVVFKFGTWLDVVYMELLL